MRFEFGKCHFDGVQVRAVRRQEEEPAPPCEVLSFKNNRIYSTIVTIIVTVVVPLDVQIIRMTSEVPLISNR